MLKPLGEKLTEFRNTVESAHKQETAQHQVMKEKIGDLEKLNERLHEDATNLSRALTSNVKAQGNWGEQQLERLLEMSGLQKGRSIRPSIPSPPKAASGCSPTWCCTCPKASPSCWIPRSHWWPGPATRHAKTMRRAGER